MVLKDIEERIATCFL